jgi:hypothetical protein
VQELQQALSPLVIDDGKRFFTNTTLPVDVRSLRACNKTQSVRLRARAGY